MSQEEQLAFCKACKNRNMDIPQAVFCNIYGDIPTFETHCSKMVLTGKMKEKAENLNIEMKPPVKVPSALWPFLLAIGGFIKAFSHGFTDVFGILFFIMGSVWLITSLVRTRERQKQHQ